jgi:quercetin dioxygenase-like cupin family protein
MNTKIVFTTVLTAFFFVFFQNCFSQESEVQKSSRLPGVVVFQPDSVNYQPVFEGPADTVSFYSGVVTLKPGEEGEIHNTEAYEEMIIILTGKGQLSLSSGDSLSLEYGRIGYVPPNTEHHIVNDGPENLKYIYVAVKADKMGKN